MRKVNGHMYQVGGKKKKRNKTGKKVPFVSLEHLGKNPGSTNMIGKTPMSFGWAKLSLLIL